MTTETNPPKVLHQVTPTAEKPPRSALKIFLLTLAILVALAEIAPRTPLVNRVVVPTPGDTLWGLWQLLKGGYWLEDLWATMKAVVIAWMIGCAAGFALGTAMGISPYTRKVVAPYAIAVQALPKIVLAPLFIGWLGFGTPSKVAIAVSICFFPVWIDTMIGLSLPSADDFKLMQALRASRWQIFRMLQLPTALPLVIVGFKHAMLLSFTGVLVAEILSSSAGGLGTLTKTFALQINMPFVFAVVLIVIVIAVSLVSILDYLEQRLVFWSDAGQRRRR
jgi:NitT/TauT family transport system permease protein